MSRGLPTLCPMLDGKRAILLLLVAGVFVHGALLVVTVARNGSVDVHAFNSLDCGEFHRIGVNVARHGVFSDHTEPPYEPDTWRTPGYPLFLAAVVLLAGESPTGMIVAQQMLSVLSVLLLFVIARRHMSERRAVLCAVLFLIEPYRLWYSLWLMSTTLFVFVLLIAWANWQWWTTSRRWYAAFLLGAVAGYAVLVRPVALLVPVVVLVGMAFSALTTRKKSDTARHARGAAPASLACLAAACSVVIGAWMVRNQRVAGHAALSDQGGVVLAYFKATEVVLWREGRTVERYLETTLDPSRLGEPHRVWDGIDERLREAFPSASEAEREALNWRYLAQGTNTSLDSFAVSDALAGIGRSLLLSSPVSTAACWLTRAGSLLTFPLNLAIQPPKGLELHRGMAAGKSLLYLLLCVGVVVRLSRARWAFHTSYFPLACTVALLVATSPQLDPRFRVPMIPFLLFVALLPASANKREGLVEQLADGAAPCIPTSTASLTSREECTCRRTASEGP